MVLNVSILTHLQKLYEREPTVLDLSQQQETVEVLRASSISLLTRKFLNQPNI